MKIPAGQAVVILLLFTNISGTFGQSSLWNDKLDGALQEMDYVVNEVIGPEYRSRKLTVDDVKNLIDVLESLLSNLEGFESLDRSVKRIVFSKSQRMIQKATQTKATVDDNLHPSEYLKAHYSLGSMLENLQRTNDLDRMCPGVQKISYEFTTKAICANVLECSEPDACTAEKRCDVRKAVPRMVAVLWYKVAAFLSNSICSDVGHVSKVTEDFKSVKDMVHIIGAYASSTVDWNSIFKEIAGAGQVFWKLNIEYAMDSFEPHAKVANFAWKACEELKSEKMCPVGSINVENTILKVMKRNRQQPSQTYNLKKQARVNHVQMLDLIRRALRQFRISASIEDLNKKIAQNSGEMSKYLHTLATYDQDIADQDVIFIKTKLEEFEKRSEEVKEKVRKDFNLVKGVAIATKVLEQAENFIVNGLDALKGIPDVAVTTASIAGLETDSRKLVEDTKELAEAFKKNANQIADMQVIVDDIKKGQIGGIGSEGADFIKAYGDYTPAVDEDLLARNDALWSAYKDKACDLLFEAEGLAAIGAQTSVGLACENLEGTLAEFSALREDIFEFQFDMVDSLAKIIRGAIGKELSKNIDLKSAATSNSYSRMMSSFFRTESRLQSEASSYCQTLQYLNHGKNIYACSNQAFFTEKNIDDLIAYEADTHYDIEERFVYIPTKAQYPGDQGHINLATLARKHKVSFRLPANQDWLNNYNWLASEENVAPFVESFNVYLPRKNYDVIQDRTKHSKARVKITAKGGSLVDLTDKVKYLTPDENSQYVTVYEEGYDPAKCPRGKEILNPYSLCDNLPFMCDTTTRVPMSSIMPTILSRWELSFSLESGAEDLKWDVPNPATDFLIIAKVKLRFPAGIRKRSRITKRDEAAFGCCEDGEYRRNWRDNACTACPHGTPSKMGGYYCEYKNNK